MSDRLKEIRRRLDNGCRICSLDVKYLLTMIDELTVNRDAVVKNLARSYGREEEKNTMIEELESIEKGVIRFTTEGDGTWWKNRLLRFIREAGGSSKQWKALEKGHE